MSSRNDFNKWFKPYVQDDTLYLGIVGASGPKWKDENKAKIAIEKYIMFFSITKGVELSKITNSTIQEILTLKLDVLKSVYEEKKSKGQLRKVVVVSGHCPIGNERWYNVTEDKWCSPEFEIGYWGLKSPIIHKNVTYVRVYDEGGVDSWAEIISAKLGIETLIFPALAMEWGDKYQCTKCDKSFQRLYKLAEHYKEKHNMKLSCKRGSDFVKVLDGYERRNLKIAQKVRFLIDLEPKGSCSYCGGMGERHHYGIVSKPDIANAKQISKNIYTTPCQKCNGDGSYSGGTWTCNILDNSEDSLGFKVIVY